MYQGAVTDVPDYFAARGHENPPNYNPADWVMNVAQSITEAQLNDDGFYPTDERPMQDAFAAEDGKDALGITLTRGTKEGGEDLRAVGIGTEISLLFQREVNNLRRDVTAVGARFGLTAFLSILFGVIFLDVGETSAEDMSVSYLCLLFLWNQ